jgi:hypothetical protein
MRNDVDATTTSTCCAADHDDHVRVRVDFELNEQHIDRRAHIFIGVYVHISIWQRPCACPYTICIDISRSPRHRQKCCQALEKPVVGNYDLC